MLVCSEKNVIIIGDFSMETAEDEKRIVLELIRKHCFCPLGTVLSDVDYLEIKNRQYTNLILYKKSLERNENAMKFLGEELAKKIKEIELANRNTKKTIGSIKFSVVPYKPEFDDVRTSYLDQNINEKLCKCIINYSGRKGITCEIGEAERLRRSDNVVVFSASYFPEMEGFVKEKIEVARQNLLAVLLVVKPPKELPVGIEKCIGLFSLDIFEKEKDLCYELYEPRNPEGI